MQLLHDQHWRSVRVVIANTNHAKFSATERNRVARSPGMHGGLEHRRISWYPVLELEPEQKPCHSVLPFRCRWGRTAGRAYDKGGAQDGRAASRAALCASPSKCHSWVCPCARPGAWLEVRRARVRGLIRPEPGDPCRKWGNCAARSAPKGRPAPHSNDVALDQNSQPGHWARSSTTSTGAACRRRPRGRRPARRLRPRWIVSPGLQFGAAHSSGSGRGFDLTCRGGPASLAPGNQTIQYPLNHALSG